MRLDTLAVRLRRRTPSQAGELGVRLCQANLGPVYSAFALAAVPLVTLALISSELAPWLPMLIIWTAQPWLDRTVIFVLSRAAFGQRTTPRDVWKAQRTVWWRHAWLSVTLRRLSPWRAVTEPVYLLEGTTLAASRARAVQIRRRQAGAGLMLAHTFVVAELCLMAALLSLVFWFAPQESGTSVSRFLFEEDGSSGLLASVAYAAAVCFLEPFYAASGFAMYLNRRSELEAWDIEQEFRRAFAA